MSVGAATEKLQQQESWFAMFPPGYLHRAWGRKELLPSQPALLPGICKCEQGPQFPKPFFLFLFETNRSHSELAEEGTALKLSRLRASEAAVENIVLAALCYPVNKIWDFVLKYRKWKWERGDKSTIGTARVRHPCQYIEHFQCNTLFPAHFYTLWMGVSLLSFGITPPDIILLIIKKLLSISKLSILFSLLLSYKSWLCFPPSF